jgi:hypothetical protein
MLNELYKKLVSVKLKNKIKERERDCREMSGLEKADRKENRAWAQKRLILIFIEKIELV